MPKWKKVSIVIAYCIVVLLVMKYNASLIVEWLNKSLFPDFSIDVDLDKVNHSFFNGESFVFFLTLLIYALIGTLIVSLLITNILLGSLIFANQVKVKERNEFITFKELQTITSPKELLSFIEVSAGTALLILVFTIFILVVAHFMIKRISHKIGFKVSVKTRFFVLILSMIPMLFIYFQPNLYNEYVLKFEEKDVHNWNPVKRAQKDGFLPSFIHTIKPDYMEKPNSYNKKVMQEINDKYTELAKDINGKRGNNIGDSQTILYLSETLMDPMRIPNLIENETPIPFIDKMIEDHIGGSMYSQYIGGGTANIEWSLLTSFSLEVFNDPMSITPYSDFYVQSKNHHTFLNFFENDKIALHPYTAHLYKRRSVYDVMGFDDFLYLNNGIKYTDKLGTHKRVSDESLHKDLLRVLSDENVGLMHVLTMQNHSPFSGEISDMDYTPKVNLDIYPKNKEQELVNYLQGIRASDIAINDLIKTIESSEKDINILLYGDHFPSLFRGLEEDFPGEQLHLTPWFLYMNHERSNKSLNIENVSPIFLTTILLKEGNYKVTPFQGLLNELLESDITRIGKNSVMTRHGEVLNEDLEESVRVLVDDYRKIVYDALFGSGYLSDDFYLFD